MPKKQLVGEALIDLHRRLSALPSRSQDRRMIMRETATLYGLSEQTRRFESVCHNFTIFA